MTAASPATAPSIPSADLGCDPETMLGLHRRAEDLAAVKGSLEAAGATAQAMHDVAEHAAFVQLSRSGRADLFWKHRPSSSAETLLKLVMGQGAVPASEFEEAAGEAAAAWLRSGIAERVGDDVRMRCGLRNLGGVWIASDLRPFRGATIPADVVLPIDRSSIILAALTVRRPAARALDLGAGNGVLSLLAARHCGEVVATDLNPRAVAYTRFNAALNELPALSARVGSGFEPVADETFDLIFSNPPFAITPDSRFVYRDSGVAGDGFVEQLARQAPARLAPGGLFQMVCQWTHVAGGDWQARLRDWFAESGCDVVVLRDRTEPIAEYAALWSRDPLGDFPSDGPERFERWMDDYRRKGIEAVSLGLISARKRSDGKAGTVRFLDAPTVRIPPAGDSVWTLFRSQDWLGRQSDDQLLGVRFQAVSGVCLQQAVESRDGALALRTATLHAPRGFDPPGRLDAFALQFFQSLDPKRTLAQLVQDVAGRTGMAKLTVKAKALPLVKAWIEWGVLAPIAADYPAGSYDDGADPAFWSLVSKPTA